MYTLYTDINTENRAQIAILSLRGSLFVTSYFSSFKSYHQCGINYHGLEMEKDVEEQILGV